MSEPLDLGCFSVSLTVADLDASLTFYSALGFSVIGGQDGWRILANGRTKIGLFQGDIDCNILTFNPGLDQDWPHQDGVSEAAGPGSGEGLPGPLADYTDVRAIEKRLLEAGIDLTRRTETESGPDHVTLVDPDGNQILIDQFF